MEGTSYTQPLPKFHYNLTLGHEPSDLILGAGGMPPILKENTRRGVKIPKMKNSVYPEIVDEKVAHMKSSSALPVRQRLGGEVD